MSEQTFGEKCIEELKPIIDRIMCVQPDCQSCQFELNRMAKLIDVHLLAQEHPQAGVIEQGRQWNQLLELQLKNLQSIYTELNDAVVGYLEMRVSYEELLPHLTLKDEKESPAAGITQPQAVGGDLVAILEVAQAALSELEVIRCEELATKGSPKEATAVSAARVLLDTILSTANPDPPLSRPARPAR